MKNQYFGDNRDLFKYDLILQIIKAGLVNHFTFIPMLTENDDTKQGDNRNRDKAKAGNKSSDLVTFLDKFAERGKRDIKRLEAFFKVKDVSITIYRSDNYFSNQERDEYFKRIDDKLLLKSLVFVDPDNGLEPERKTEKKHIKYCEVKSLHDRMDMSSILMIFQHYPRLRTENNIQKHFYERSEKLKNITGDLPIYIDDNEVRFFFLTKNGNVRESLAGVIQDYKKTYPELA